MAYTLTAKSRTVRTLAVAEAEKRGRAHHSQSAARTPGMMSTRGACGTGRLRGEGGDQAMLGRGEGDPVGFHSRVAVA